MQYPEAYTRSQRAVVTPLVEYWTGSARSHLWIMLGASLLLLVASMMSASNLLLSRILARRSEIATRLALGAQRRQILTQLGVEGLLVAAVASAAGLGIAEAAVRSLVRWSPADIPRLAEASLDLSTFLFAAGAAAVAAIACTVIPAWSATRGEIEALREGGVRSSMSRRAGRTRNVFLLAQAAVTTMLLAMAFLLALSYRSMMSADTGFANRDAVTMNLQLRHLGKETRSTYAELLRRLREAPGVTSAGAVLVRPLEGTIGWDVPYSLEFETQDNRVLPKGNYEAITPGYFATVGTAIVEGRDFDDHDSAESEQVAVISRTLAQRIREAGQSPVGHRLKLGLGAPRWLKIVGVTADARYRSITQRGVDLFVPYLQAVPSTNYLAIRGNGDLTGLVRRTLAAIDPSQAVAGIATIGELIDRNAARHRFNMMLLIWFGICAAILAAMGVYSLIAETMTEREREIAIRSALGATRVRLVRDMVSRTLVFVAFGELLGAAVVGAGARAGAELLYGVSARDPLVLGSRGSVFVCRVPGGGVLAGLGGERRSGWGFEGVISAVIWNQDAVTCRGCYGRHAGLGSGAVVFERSGHAEAGGIDAGELPVDREGQLVSGVHEGGGGAGDRDSRGGYRHANAGDIAAEAKKAGLTGLAVEGSLSAGKVDMPVVELTNRAEMKFGSDAHILATKQGMWPGIRAEQDGLIAAPTGAPWIDTNTGFLRYARVSTHAAIWIAERVPEKKHLLVTAYLAAIGDAGMTGARWVLDFDDEFAKGLTKGDATALKNWALIVQHVKFYEDHKELRGYAMRSTLALVEAPESGALISGGVLDMMATKHTPVTPIPASVAQRQVAAAVEDGGERRSGAAIGESERGAEGIYEGRRNAADRPTGLAISIVAAGSDHARQERPRNAGFHLERTEHGDGSR